MSDATLFYDHDPDGTLNGTLIKFSSLLEIPLFTDTSTLFD